MVELIVVEVAGFVLRDPFDSPGRIPVPLYGDINLAFWIFSPRPRTFIVEGGFYYYAIAVLTRVTYYK